ncbi:hypothetical protein FE904_07085 [Chryseobacterium indologenes]|uniref:hypothetical protein n=1 Tax=Chryseobacterium indologenes TaxID=253 RepID=UPI001109DDEA|nr:hypothetical protein [Chryseobacterium indologenes]TLX26610.1 hypothetical protein FE904_07085 [Chryseobacterium indologenes]
MTQPVYGQESSATTQLKSPPFIGRTSGFMGMGFRLNAHEAQKLLPKGIIVKTDGNGSATGNLEIYKTDQVFGVPAYTIAFFVIEVKTQNDQHSKEGNWIVWGTIDNKEALNSFRHFYNLPHSYSKDIFLDTSGVLHNAKVGNNTEGGFELTLKKIDTQPVRAEGLAVILNSSANNKFIKLEIPWLAEGHQTDIVSFKINPGESSILNVLQHIEPFYSQVSSNVFSYSKLEK